jgi:ligand-binding sensor domain-containing protein
MVRTSLSFKISVILAPSAALGLYTNDDFRPDDIRYVHDRWGEDEGFIGGRIYAIRQSADGYLWIGTERGLVRFDGSNFTLIQRPLPNSPPISPVRGLVTDASGNLWIRLEGPRMLLYHDGKFEDPYARFDLQDITFTATVSDDKGRVILSGLGDRTFRYEDGRLETIVSADQNADTGGLWIGTDNGIHLWEGGVLATLNLPSSLRQLQILAMARDHDANVWIGTNHGIVRITPSGAVSLDQLNPKPGFEVTAIYEDLDGDIWFGGSRGSRAPAKWNACNVFDF